MSEAPARRRRARAGRLTACAAALCSHLLAAPALPAVGNAHGHTAPPSSPSLRDVDAAFRDTPLDAPTIDADASFAAQRAWTWTSNGVQRLLLERDVRVRIDGHHFAASRAHVWIAPRLSGSGQPVQRVAVYLEDVETPEADAAIAQRADRLLVTAALRGRIVLHTALRAQATPPATLRNEAEQRLLAAMTPQRTPPLTRSPVRVQPFEKQRPPPVTPEPLPPAARLAQTPAGEPLFERQGVVSFAAPHRTLIRGEQQNAIVLTGGVSVQYAAPARQRSLTITAPRAVVFTTPGAIAETLRFGLEDLRGVYLEGGVVASDGRYTLRGPRMYYDIRSNRAVVLDGVFYTFDETAGVPLYARAKAIRQESTSQWTAGDVQLANAAFFQPQFTIGATSVTLVRQEPEGGGPSQSYVEAKGVSLRYRNTPILPLPDYKGRAGELPITEASVETRAGRPVVRTRWNIASLLGVSPPQGLDAELLLDGYFTRGPAAGVDLRWKTADAEGALLGYTIFDDGEDRLSSGAEINRDSELRGLLLAEHRWRLNDRWSLFLELSKLSDEAFVDAFFPQMVDTRREFTSSIYIRRLDESSLFSLEARGSFDDFAPNGYLLQSQGFLVDRLPEIRYARPADALLGGFLLASSEVRLGAIRTSLFEPDVREFGFDTRARALAAFGLLPPQSLAQRLRRAGFTEDVVLRADAKEQLTLPLQVGPINVAPFVSGRITAYDTDFDRFRRRAGSSENDSVRLRATAGVRAATSVVRVDDSVESRLFDLHRIRHIIEPSLTLWSAVESASSTSLPPIDQTVESLAEGTALRLGVTNTWQTQRPDASGTLRSVDWLTLRTDYVAASSDADKRTPIPRFFEHEPELSSLGEHASASLAWRLTNATTLVSDVLYDLETDRVATASGGALFDHGQGFSSFIEARAIDVVDSLFLRFGAAYELTPRYALSWSAVYNADKGSVQSTRATFVRRFAQWTLEVGVDLDDIREDVALSFVIRPAGLGPARRTRIFTREPEVGTAEDRFRPVQRRLR